MKYRINGFDQIKAFYSLVFENKHPIKPQHISLYVFLINQNNRNNWVEWFKCPFDLAMAGACIGNKRTYYNCLNDLQSWGLIQYKKGVNDWKAPQIKIEVLKCTATETATETATVPQSEPLLQQPEEQALQQLLPHIYKPLTSNLKLIMANVGDFKKMINSFIKEKKQESNKKNEFDLSFVSTPMRPLVLEFIRYRRQDIKKPFKTERGVVTFYNKLIELSNNNYTKAKELVEHAKGKEWQSVYPIKSEPQKSDSKITNKNINDLWNSRK